MIVQRTIATALAAATLALLAAAAANGQDEPHYWRQRLFFIPYQPNRTDPIADQVAKVQLLLSRDGGRQWAVLQEAEPHVRGFSYHAPEDGAYWFALRVSDRRGRTWPETVAQPMLHVIVDTQPPRLDVIVNVDAAGQIVVQYEARDARLKPETLRLEAQSGGLPWQRVSLGPPEVSQPDRIQGRVAWQAPASTSGLRVRAAIEDAAGNAVTVDGSPRSSPPILDPPAGPQLVPPGGAWTGPDARASDDTLTWPAHGGTTASPAAAPVSTADPLARTSPRTDAQLISDGGAPSLLASDAAGAWVSGGGATEGPLVDAPPPSAADGVTWVNSLTFDVDYDIQTVGPWGVAKVELWGTRDGGRQWLSLGVDQDNRSPMRVTVPGEGVYGFRIVVDGGNGAAASPPQPGDQPEMSVGVDLQTPRAELRAAELGQGALAGTLVIRWAADDDRLAARPVGLFFSVAAEGPWSTIATDLENTGEYSWRLERDAPPRVHLRLEVRDAAGNVAVQQTGAPVELNLPQPKGRVRSVRPVPTEPSRFRTASGSQASGR